MIYLRRKVLLFILTPAVFIVFGFLLIPLPDPLFSNSYSTVLYDKNGALLGAHIAKDEQWRFPIRQNISEKFETCLILFEDEYFYFHPGFNPVSIIKALYANYHAGKIVRGGSTITMQAIRIAFGNKPRTYSQKTLELLSAIKLEFLYSKKEILKLYAGHAPFGGNIVGYDAASWLYFKRSADELSWAEAATLAVLPNDPSGVFPGKNNERLKRKRNLLLDKLQSRKIIDSTDCYLAKQEPLPKTRFKLPNEAYHLLHTAKTEGFEGKPIPSSIDAGLQKGLNELVERYAKRLFKNQVYNVAALIVNAEKGKVLAYKGNVHSGGEHGEFVDIIRSKRSPGSLLKPFLYASALDEGLIYPKQLLPDIPLIYKGFAPKNFDKKFRGSVPADKALSGSLNVPFVFLLRDFGYEKLHWKLKELGMNSLTMPSSHYGLSLILGGAETTLWEITALYAGLVRSYQKFGERPFKKGYSKNDFRQHSYLENEEQDISGLQSKGHLSYSSIAHTLKALQELKRPVEESGWEQFASSRSIAWKTGTSYGFKDAWAVGCSHDYVVGVWAGNADGEGRPGLVGVKAAAPLMFRIFDLLETEASFDALFGIEFEVCAKSGMKKGPYCEDSESITMPEKYSDSELCKYHKKIYLTADQKNQVNSQCYDLDKADKKNFFILPPVQSWYYEQYHPEYESPPPFLPGCRTETKNSKMAMIYPKNKSRVFIPREQDGQKGKAIFELAHTQPENTVYWHLNENFIGQTRHVHQMGINVEKGLHSLTLVDQNGSELQFQFEVLN